MMSGKVPKMLRRFPMSFAMKYTIGPPGVPQSGVGETVWMSRTEVAFHADGPACVGDKLVICIEWPVLLRGEVPLQLAVGAQIVQRLGPLTVAKLTKHEFRTRGLQSVPMAGRYRANPAAWDWRPANPMRASNTVECELNRQRDWAAVAGR